MFLEYKTYEWLEVGNRLELHLLREKNKIPLGVFRDFGLFSKTNDINNTFLSEGYCC